MIHLDLPTSIADSEAFVFLKGWYAGELEEAPVVVRLLNASFTCQQEPRPDVAAAYPQHHTFGFRCFLDFTRVDLTALKESGDALRVRVEVGDGETKEFGFQVGSHWLAYIVQAIAGQAKKAEWLRRALQPRYALPQSLPFVCLNNEQRKRFKIDPTDNIAMHRYDNQAQALMLMDEMRESGGMILDCGAGFKPWPLSQVVMTDIVEYPSTDVVCVNQELPFKDEVFDVIFSLNVLEHVPDPAACVAELMRVLKPNGLLYCVVPFLQPEHGYPHHYFNMTRQGLKVLFEEYGEIQWQRVIPSGAPIWTVHWILDWYARGLPEGEQEQFRNLKVSDLLAKTPEEWLAHPLTQHLADDARWKLASTTAIMMRKS